MCQSSGNDKEFDTNAVCIKCTYNLCPGLHQLRSWGWGSMQTMKVMKCLSNFTQQANKNSNRSPRNNPNTNPNPNITIKYTLWHLLVKVKNPIPPTRWPTRRLTRGLTNHQHTTDTCQDYRHVRQRVGGIRFFTFIPLIFIVHLITCNPGLRRQCI